MCFESEKRGERNDRESSGIIIPSKKSNFQDQEIVMLQTEDRDGYINFDKLSIEVF